MLHPQISYPYTLIKIGEKYFTYFGYGFPEGYPQTRGDKTVYHTNKLQGSSITLHLDDPDFLTSLILLVPNKDYRKVESSIAIYNQELSRYNEEYSKSVCSRMLKSIIGVSLLTFIAVFTSTPGMATLIFTASALLSLVYHSV